MGKSFNFHVTKDKFSIEDLSDLERDGKLILEAYYQRSSIWKEKQQYPLIDSALRKYPIPPVFLARRKNGRSNFYRCIDGQQRLRTLIGYYREDGFSKNPKFKVKQLPRSSITIDPSHVNQSYKELGETKKKIYKNYKISAVIVHTTDDEFEEELYQRLNSNVEKVNDQELRYAKYHGNLRTEVINVSAKYKKFVLENGILSHDQIQRKQDAEKIWNKMFLIALHGRVVDVKKEPVDLMYEKGRGFKKAKEITNKIHKAMETLQMIFPPVGGLDRKYRNFSNPSIFTAPNDFVMLLYAIYMMQQRMFDDKTNSMRKNVWRFPTKNPCLKKMRERLEDFSTNTIGLRKKKRRKVYTKKDVKLVKEYNKIYIDRHFGQANNDLAKSDIMKDLMIKFCKDVSRGATAGKDEREEVWLAAMTVSRDRKVRCGRCGQVIETFEEMDTGHVVKKIDGGPKILKNLQPEHGRVAGYLSCNRTDNQKKKF